MHKVINVYSWYCLYVKEKMAHYPGLLMCLFNIQNTNKSRHISYQYHRIVIPLLTYQDDTEVDCG